MNDYVLLIEDDCIQQCLISSMLKQFVDCDVVVMDSAVKALECISKSTPQLIVCDLQMPEMDGADFLYHLSKTEKNIPIIIASEVHQSVIASVQAMAFAFGISQVSVLQKPVSLKSIRQHVANAFLMANRNDGHNDEFSPTESEINIAFTNGQFEVYFQPQADTESGRTVGLEALVRWNHPSNGVLPPFYFLDSVHQVGRSYDLFKTVLDKALSAVKKLHEDGYPLSVSVNVETQVLTEYGFIELVTDALGMFAFPPSNLILELTETRAPKRNCDLLRAMSRLRMKGIQISIDDFGTGNSSLIQLVEGPFTELKIDMSFVKQMLSNHKHMAAVRSSIELARSLDIKVVAEGVETYDQFRRLQMLGCDLIQGFYFSKPLSMLETQRFVANAISLYDNNIEPETLCS